MKGGGGGSNWTHPHPTLPEKATLKKSSLISVEMSSFIEEITVQVSVVFWSCLSPIPFFDFYPISTVIKLAPFGFYLFEDFLKFFCTTPSIAYIYYIYCKLQFTNSIVGLVRLALQSN